MCRILVKKEKKQTTKKKKHGLNGPLITICCRIGVLQSWRTYLRAGHAKLTNFVERVPFNT